jgi:hypothetical protein
VKELKEMQAKLNLTDEEVEELARQKRNEYIREWRARNKEKRAATHKKHWQKKALRALLEKEAN